MRIEANRVQFGTGYCEFKDLYLLELHQHGATVQIILGTAVSMYTSVYPTSVDIAQCGQIDNGASYPPFC